MSKGKRICKVCGKEYDYCKTWLSQDKFRWQDVACSPECAQIYFVNVAKARGQAVESDGKSSESYEE